MIKEEDISDLLKIEVEYKQKQAPLKSSIYRTVSSSRSRDKSSKDVELGYIGWDSETKEKAMDYAWPQEVYFIKSLGKQLDIYELLGTDPKKVQATARGIDGYLTSVYSEHVSEGYTIKKDYKYWYVSATHGTRETDFGTYATGMWAGREETKDVSRDYLASDMKVSLEGKLESKDGYHTIKDGFLKAEMYVKKTGFDYQKFVDAISSDLGESAAEMFKYGKVSMIEFGEKKELK